MENLSDNTRDLVPSLLSVELTNWLWQQLEQHERAVEHYKRMLGLIDDERGVE